MQQSGVAVSVAGSFRNEELTHPLAEAIVQWFDHYPLAHITGLSAGSGPNGFFEPSRTLFLNMLGSFDCGLRILDLGCGFGEDAITLSGKTNQVWGIDIADQRLKVAEARARIANRSDRIFIRNMDVHNLRFENDYFDLIVANSFLMWVHKDRAVAECHRVLKPGGKVIFSCESMGKNPLLALHRHRRPLHTRESLVTRVTLHDLGELSKRFTASRWRQFYLVSPLLFPLALRFPRNGVVRRITRLVQFLDERVLRLWPASRPYAWVSVIEFTK